MLPTRPNTILDFLAVRRSDKDNVEVLVLSSGPIINTVCPSGKILKTEYAERSQAGDSQGFTSVNNFIPPGWVYNGKDIMGYNLFMKGPISFVAPNLKNQISLSRQRRKTEGIVNTFKRAPLKEDLDLLPSFLKRQRQL